MPKKPNIRRKSKNLWVRQQKKLADGRNMQGGHVEDFENGQPIIRLGQGGRLRHSQNFSRGSVGIGDSVNPTISAIPKHDYLGETAIDIVTPTLSDLT